MVNFLKPSSAVLRFWSLCLLSFWCLSANAANEEISLTIADPFIELHSGAGTGYPIFYVIDRGEKVVILKRKTEWFKIRAESGQEGWASKQQMQKTLLPSGENLKINEATREAFIERRWEIGVTGGEFQHAPVMSAYGAFTFTQNLSTELTLAHSIGNISSSNFFKLNVLMQPFPQWKYSPFFTLGIGSIQVKPNATLIEPADKSNQLGQIGLGFKTYLSRRFIFRFEANDYVIFSASNDNDKNEDLSEWKLGFAIFF